LTVVSVTVRGSTVSALETPRADHREAPQPIRVMVSADDPEVRIEQQPSALLHLLEVQRGDLCAAARWQVGHRLASRTWA
jgi:hypothetical protein